MKNPIYKKKGGTLTKGMIKSNLTPGAGTTQESVHLHVQNFNNRTQNNNTHIGGKKKTKKMYGGDSSNCHACLNPKPIHVVQVVSPDGIERKGPQSANGNIKGSQTNLSKGACQSISKDSKTGQCLTESCAANQANCPTAVMESSGKESLAPNHSGGSKRKRSKKRKYKRSRKSKNKRKSKIKRKSKKRW